jgi:hypothetical protein
MKLNKPKKVTVTTIKNKAWSMFSTYIRLKYADENGYVTCYTCGVTRHYKDRMQAGHGIEGRNNAVLFMEEIVRPQCVGCNMFGQGKISVFTEKLIKEYGPDKYAEFVFESNKEKKLKAENYEAIYEAYRDLVKQLKET